MFLFLFYHNVGPLNSKSTKNGLDKVILVNLIFFFPVKRILSALPILNLKFHLLSNNTYLLKIDRYQVIFSSGKVVSDHIQESKCIFKLLSLQHKVLPVITKSSTFRYFI